MEKEIWKQIENYPNYYVSNYGNVLSKSKNKSILLKKSKNHRGYWTVRLYNKEGWKQKFVHRLVALGFIPNPKNAPQINHKDGNKENNCVENLEWCTNKENQIHSYANRLRKLKIVQQYSKNGELLNEYISVAEASRKTKIGKNNISNCIYNFSKTAGGYIWKYKCD